ncbi:MAG: hypothetical protein ABR516_01770 [Desulfuromonadaceae bacterium]|nr:hypothetical protein [Geobacteraceae bacterium]
MSTKAEEFIDNLLKQVEPGSTRYTILHSAKQFKSSWVELGQLLSEVRHAQLYQEWGYTDFADYCAREIRIRRQTADKLTHAYHYLKEHNPTTLSDPQNPVPMPDYRSLNLLEQINSEALMEEEELQSLQHQVFSGTLAHPKLARTVRDLKREQAPSEIKEYTDIKNALSAAKRFQSSLEHLPEEISARVNLDSFVHAAEQALVMLEPPENKKQSGDDIE